MKTFFTSKTVWIAILQGIVGVITAATAGDPAVATIGWVTMIKSTLDIVIRVFGTSQPITLK